MDVSWRTATQSASETLLHCIDSDERLAKGTLAKNKATKTVVSISCEWLALALAASVAFRPLLLAYDLDISEQEVT